jgi:rhamnopyranosyl-N-acetylglucosaminyl-diphospho-decaprenol beta-1,3/1,4-galactofuranosyltransferase
MTHAPVIVATVVTHHRRADLAKCLDAITRQTRSVDQIIVIDNASTDGTSDDLAAQPSIHVIRLDCNVGGAGGFRRAIEAGLDAQADYLWLMDDDCLPCADALEKLADAASARLATGGFAGFLPTVAYNGVDRHCGFVGPLPLPPGERDGGPFLGLLLAADACRAIGPVRDDFFILGDDSEYCWRLRIGGWRFEAVPDATVVHPLEEPLVKTIFGRRLTLPAVHPWKQYYRTRNSMIVEMDMRATPSAARRPRRGWMRRELNQLVLTLILDRRWGWRRVIMHSWGIIDALRGRTGAPVAPEQSLPSLRRGRTRSTIARNHAVQK